MTRLEEQKRGDKGDPRVEKMVTRGSQKTMAAKGRKVVKVNFKEIAQKTMGDRSTTETVRSAAEKVRSTKKKSRSITEKVRSTTEKVVSRKRRYTIEQGDKNAGKNRSEDLIPGEKVQKRDLRFYARRSTSDYQGVTCKKYSLEVEDVAFVDVKEEVQNVKDAEDATTGVVDVVGGASEEGAGGDQENILSVGRGVMALAAAEVGR